MEEKKGDIVKLSWKYNHDNRAERKAGKYFIRTSIHAQEEQLLWKLYRILGEIESSFKVLKSDLDMPNLPPERRKYRSPPKHGRAGIFYSEFHSPQAQTKKYPPPMVRDSQNNGNSKMQYQYDC